MSKYSFHEGSTQKFKSSFETFLYNEERHRHTQSAEGWSTFYLLDESANKVLGQVHFHLKDKVALSPFQAPFGSVEFNEDISAEVLSELISKTEAKLIKKGARKIIIKDTPHIFRPQQSALLSVLLSDHGFKVCSNEISSSILVDEVVWENKISKDELYHFKRCQREQLRFEPLDIAKLVEVYRFIENCRHERGMSLSMTLDQLIMTVRNCPNDFLLFGVFLGEEMVAAAISIRVNGKILYDFYYGHSKESNHLSPVVFLLNGQYSFCKEKGFRILDLGTSSLNGRTNFSLLNFKSQVGGVPSMKLTFEKELR